jgi:phage tail protein X
MEKNLVVIVYDSILNSVFQGQIVVPLVNKLCNGRYKNGYIISFENETIDQRELTRITCMHPQLNIIVVRRGKFIAPWLLGLQTHKLYKILKKIPGPYDISARGALAGLLVLKIIKKFPQSTLTVQARGLLAEEYRHEHKHCRGITALLHQWRAKQYATIERLVYGLYSKTFNYTIEAVSAALEEYLIQTFGTNPACVVRAIDDIPFIAQPEKIKLWRAATREKLQLDSTKTVYCFSGAVKTWQDPLLVINYFTNLLKKNTNVFLLILTPQEEQFKKLLQQHLPESTYFVTAVAHEHVYEYMAAADVGLIFREPGIISWISRPVKAMEYEAIGLLVVHNNTVDWLLQRYGTNRSLQ